MVKGDKDMKNRNFGLGIEQLFICGLCEQMFTEALFKLDSKYPVHNVDIS